VFHELMGAGASDRCVYVSGNLVCKNPFENSKKPDASCRVMARSIGMSLTPSRLSDLVTPLDVFAKLTSVKAKE
jgi:hypothetical protein